MRLLTEAAECFFVFVFFTSHIYTPDCIWLNPSELLSFTEKRAKDPKFTVQPMTSGPLITNTLVVMGMK